MLVPFNVKRVGYKMTLENYRIAVTTLMYILVNVILYHILHLNIIYVKKY